MYGVARVTRRGDAPFTLLTTKRADRPVCELFRTGLPAPLVRGGRLAVCPEAAMAKRAGISKAKRFRIYERDKFTCQYCGRKAPDIILQIDHITPHALTQDDTDLNLTTSCVECNAGKSDRVLDPASAALKKRAQMELEHEHKEQLLMLVDWQRRIIEGRIHEGDLVIEYANYWLNPEYSINDNGRAKLISTFKVYGLETTQEAIDRSFKTYMRDGKTKESVEEALSKIKPICKRIVLEKENPYIADACHILNVFNKYSGRYRDGSMSEVVDYLAAGLKKSDLMLIASRKYKYWYEFIGECNALVQKMKEEGHA